MIGSAQPPMRRQLRPAKPQQSPLAAEATALLVLPRLCLGPHCLRPYLPEEAAVARNFAGTACRPCWLEAQALAQQAGGLSKRATEAPEVAGGRPHATRLQRAVETQRDRLLDPFTPGSRPEAKAEFPALRRCAYDSFSQ